MADSDDAEQARPKRQFPFPVWEGEAAILSRVGPTIVGLLPVNYKYILLGMSRPITLCTGVKNRL